MEEWRTWLEVFPTCVREGPLCLDGGVGGDCWRGVEHNGWRSSPCASARGPLRLDGVGGEPSRQGWWGSGRTVACVMRVAPRWRVCCVSVGGEQSVAACASQSVRGLWRRVPHSLYVRQFIFSVHVFFAAAIHLSVVSANASLFMKVLAERLGHDVPVFSPSWFVAPLAQTAISTFQNTIIYRDGAGRGRDMGRLCIG